MASYSAISSLPPKLTLAYRILSAAMSGRFPRHNYDDVFDAIQGFVYELRQEPAWSEELDRRATFLEKGCGAGSPWREVADKAVELLPDAIETDRFCWTAVFLSKTGKKKPYWRITETTVGVFSQLQNVITLVKQLLDIEGLSSSARAALKEWLRQSVDLRDKAVSLKADGCQLLYLIYSDSKKPMTTGKKPIKVPSGKKAIKKAMEEAAKNAMEAQSGAESLLKTVPKLFQPVHYAVDSMAAWVAEHPVAPDAQPDGNGGNDSVKTFGKAALGKLFGLTGREIDRFLERHPKIRNERPITKAGKPDPHRLMINVLDFSRALSEDDLRANCKKTNKQIMNNLKKIELSKDIENIALEMLGG